MQLHFTQLSDVGRVRAQNQDSVLCQLGAGDGPHLLIVVADGMGGAAAGEVASRLAVQTLAEVYFADETPPSERLQRAVLLAGERILDTGEQDPAMRGLGTTCTALALAPEGSALVHLGDSRAYRLRDGQIARLTRDMSVWATRVRGGAAPSSEYGRNQLSEALGVRRAPEDVMCEGVEVRPGDRFLLCSDGLWGLVTDPEMLRIAACGPLEAAAQRLIALANARGGEDNVSVVLAAATE